MYNNIYEKKENICMSFHNLNLLCMVTTCLLKVCVQHFKAFLFIFCQFLSRFSDTSPVCL